MLISYALPHIYATFTKVLPVTFPISSTSMFLTPPSDTDVLHIGSPENYWVKFPHNGTFDLTRSVHLPVTSPKEIPMLGTRKSAIIEPTRAALVTVDMQNYFLHPIIAPGADSGRAIVPVMVDVVKVFRKAGVKVLWTNWGIDDADLLSMPPALIDGYSRTEVDGSTRTLGDDLGIIDDIPAGRKLFRGSWNTQEWDLLYDFQQAGVFNGTDVVLYKNRLSGLWNTETALARYLQENDITTLFLSGVNADQCVWDTYVDAFSQGYDVIYVSDISATENPDFAAQMVMLNSNYMGFVTNSTLILNALEE